MKIESYTVECPIDGICKQHAVWGEEGTYIAPLIYLQRPKWIANNKQWLTIVASIRLELPAGFEVGGL